GEEPVIVGCLCKVQHRGRHPSRSDGDGAEGVTEDTAEQIALRMTLELPRRSLIPKGGKPHSLEQIWPRRIKLMLCGAGQAGHCVGGAKPRLPLVRVVPGVILVIIAPRLGFPPCVVRGRTGQPKLLSADVAVREVLCRLNPLPTAFIDQ